MHKRGKGFSKRKSFHRLFTQHGSQTFVNPNTFALDASAAAQRY